MPPLKRRQPSRRERSAKSGVRRVAVLAVALLVAVGVVATIVLLKRGGLGGTGSSPPSPSSHPGVAAPTAAPSFQILHGRWLRRDGGYILDIRDIDARGKLNAVYLNPRPITVARAEATRHSSTLHVFVELRAPGYPGSTYTLIYDAQRDQLAGEYFQAALQQRFDVAFVRMK